MLQPLLLLGLCAAQALRVCSFNVWGLYTARHREVRIAALGEELAVSDYDIVGLQELWMGVDYEYLQGRLHTRFPHSAYYQAGAVGSGLALFSRHPITEVQYRQFPLGGRPGDLLKGDWFAAKGVAIAHLECHGQPLAILNTHMAASYNRTVGGPDAYETHRLIHAFEYGRLLRDQLRLVGRVIGLGDFNLQPASPAYQAFLLDGLGLFGSGVQSAFPAEPLTFNDPRNTYRRAGEPRQAIDHLFYAGDLVPTAAATALDRLVPHYNVSLSDHLGLAGTFRLGGQSALHPADAPASLTALIVSRVEGEIRALQRTQQADYAWSALLLLASALLLTGACADLYTSGLQHRLRPVVLLATAGLAFALGFAELFNGFAFVAAELAAHRQFLAEFLALL